MDVTILLLKPIGAKGEGKEGYKKKKKIQKPNEGKKI